MPYVTIVGVLILTRAAIWRVYEKAGVPGWASLIPLYNSLVMLRIVRRPAWWLLLMVVPGLNLIFGTLVWIDLLAAFGQPAWHVALVFLAPFIYLPYLGFSRFVYYRGG
jgi:hypothetical protein